MRTIHESQARHFLIKSEYDVIAMRQEVRQVTRDIGLGLAQQAKIAAAISTVARALIATDYGATMQVSTRQAAPRPMLEISCLLANQSLQADLHKLGRELHFDEVQALVDEASLCHEADATLLNLRMWINRRG